MTSFIRIAFRFGIALGSLSVLACSGPAPAAIDGGIIINPPDAGPPDVGADSGPDASDGLCADLTTLPLSTPGLPPECLPRCTSETRTAVLACTDGPCEEAAHGADPTPPASFRTMYGIYTVACGEVSGTYPCYIWQLYSCFELYCRTEFYAYSDCSNAGGDCASERDAINACMGAMPEAMTCMRDRVASCYAP